MGGILDFLKPGKKPGDDDPSPTEPPDGDGSESTDEGGDASKDPKKPKIDPSQVTCEKKSEHQMHCTFSLDESQFEGLKRTGNIASGTEIDLTMIGIISSTIILVVLLGAFIFVFVRFQKGGGSHRRRSGRKSLKSKISGGKSRHSSMNHSSAVGSKKRGKSSRLSKKSAGKSGLSSKKKGF